MHGPTDPSRPPSAHAAQAGHRDAWAQLAGVPALGFLAAGAALLDLAAARVGVRILDAAHQPDLLAALMHVSSLPQNVGVLAGLVALVAAFVAFVAQPLTQAEVSAAALAVFRRVSLAAFAIVFVFIVMAATFLPAHYTVRAIVLLAITSGSVVTLLVVLHAVSQPGPRSTRVALALLGTASALSLLSLLLGEVFQQVGLDAPLPVDALYQIGETAYLVAPIPMAVHVLVTPTRPPQRSFRNLWVALGGASVVFALIVFADTTLPGESFPDLLYASGRVELFLSEAPWLLFLFLALPFGTALAGLTNIKTGHAQASVGLLLIATAGYAPPNPARALWSLLGVVLIARSSLEAGARFVTLRQAEQSLSELDRDLA